MVLFSLYKYDKNKTIRMAYLSLTSFMFLAPSVSNYPMHTLSKPYPIRFGMLSEWCVKFGKNKGKSAKNKELIFVIVI